MAAFACITVSSLSGARSFAALKMRASQFQHILGKTTLTEQVYAGNPLAAVSYSRRGFLLQKWAKRFLAEKYPDLSMLQPHPGQCIDGRKRSTHNAEYDVLFGGRRVKLKSAQLCFNRHRSCWEVTWRGIKLQFPGCRSKPAFDDLYVTLLTPGGLHLFKHDLSTGVSRDGQRTEQMGHVIQLYGSSKDSSWKAAAERIVDRLCSKGSCLDLGYTQIGDRLVQELLWEDHDSGVAFYKDTPLAFMNGAARGNLIQWLVFEVDQHLHGQSTFSFPEGEETYLGSGRIRGSANTTTDWIRDGMRIETKHAKLCYNEKAQRWQCRFQGIKKDLFDELLLAIYSPEGIFIFLYNNSLHLTLSGVYTECLGHQLCLCGPVHEPQPSHALKAILAKLSSCKCQHVATILWD